LSFFFSEDTFFALAFGHGTERPWALWLELQFFLFLVSSPVSYSAAPVLLWDPECIIFQMLQFH
jgi:hypothetical protein